MQLWLGLTLAFISAIAVNWAYAREHDAAAAMPPFSPRRPVRFVSLLLSNHRWLVGFATETAGWLVYVAALRLAPLSLVQAICASGIAVLAFATAHGHPTRLARHEQIAVVIAFAGLVLLSLSPRRYTPGRPPTRLDDGRALARLLRGRRAHAGQDWHRPCTRPRARPRRRPALRRRRHLRQARRLRRHLVCRRPQSDRLLRTRHQHPPRGLPARRCANRRRPRDPRHQRDTDRRRIHRLWRTATRGPKGSVASCGVRLARCQRRLSHPRPAADRRSGARSLVAGHAHASRANSFR